MNQWGKHLEDLRKIEEKTGQTPQALLNRPVPNTWNTQYWEAFTELSSSRTYTFGGIAGIPYSELSSWLDDHGIFDLDERYEYTSVIQALDDAHVKMTNDKIPKPG